MRRLILMLLLMSMWALPAAAGSPLIGDNGIITQVPKCPDWPGSQGLQMPTLTWHNPQPTPIYITGVCLILSMAGNVPAADMWSSVYRVSDQSRLFNIYESFNKGTAFAQTVCRDFGPNYFVLQVDDALTLGAGCVAYSTVPAAGAGVTMNVTYSTVRP